MDLFGLGRLVRMRRRRCAGEQCVLRGHCLFVPASCCRHSSRALVVHIPPFLPWHFVLAPIAMPPLRMTGSRRRPPAFVASTEAPLGVRVLYFAIGSQPETAFPGFPPMTLVVCSFPCTHVAGQRFQQSAKLLARAWATTLFPVECWLGL